MEEYKLQQIFILNLKNLKKDSIACNNKWYWYIYMVLVVSLYMVLVVIYGIL